MSHKYRAAVGRQSPRPAEVLLLSLSRGVEICVRQISLAASKQVGQKRFLQEKSRFCGRPRPFDRQVFSFRLTDRHIRTHVRRSLAAKRDCAPRERARAATSFDQGVKGRKTPFFPPSGGLDEWITRSSPGATGCAFGAKLQARSRPQFCAFRPPALGGRCQLTDNIPGVGRFKRAFRRIPKRETDFRGRCHPFPRTGRSISLTGATNTKGNPKSNPKGKPKVRARLKNAVNGVGKKIRPSVSRRRIPGKSTPA